MFNEVWKQITNFDNYYISSYGRIKSNFNIIRKPQITKYGYVLVRLKGNDGKYKTMRVHRIVAQEFIPNPINYPQVNHKDEIKSNNHVDNLEWCDNKYNSNYGTINIKRSKSHINNPKCIKAVIGINIKTNKIIEGVSATELSRTHGFNRKSICDCCNKKRKTHKGYMWRYKC